MIELKNINKTYHSGKISFQALKNIDLKIEQGEFIAIMGASGSGKSTLLHILGFLDPPDEGIYNFFGKNVAKLEEHKITRIRNQAAGFVFQQFHLLPGVKAQENVSLPQIYAGKKKFKNTALEKLTAVGLKERAHHVPNELSGGERQRVAIARALVNDPVILFADEPTGNLDTKSEAEIMAILKELNQQGMTIVMVTHEQEIASQAERIITMRDGRIIADRRQREKNISNKLKEPEIIEKIINDGRSKTSGAEFLDHIKQALHAMSVNKLRTFLSMLGILIGVAAVITMLALGTGATKAIKENLSSLGSNSLIIRPGSTSSGGVSLGAAASGTSRFVLTDLEKIKKIPSVKYASAEMSKTAQVVYGNSNWSTTITGASKDYVAMQNAQPVSGRFFNEQEVQQREKVAIIGKTVNEKLFGKISPLGKIIKINRINFKVIGVLPEKGYERGRDGDDKIIIPITTAMYRLIGRNYIDTLQAEIINENQLETAKKEITAVLNKSHGWKPEDEKVNIRDMTEIQKTITGTIKTISMLLGSVAAIALLVGGIGIMNIMLVSVTERTREIGLRKAIGAGKKDILSQFLVEAIVMTTSGGILGVLLGFLVSSLISLIGGWTTEVSSFSVVVSAGFSIIVGVIFGLWPARQAANLNTIDALRYE